MPNLHTLNVSVTAAPDRIIRTRHESQRSQSECRWVCASKKSLAGVRPAGILVSRFWLKIRSIRTTSLQRHNIVRCGRWARLAGLYRMSDWAAVLSPLAMTVYFAINANQFSSLVDWIGSLLR